ncbi:TrkH family potassium uptake protein [Methanobacterium spitsbergense]|uniref:TrkH family potassium uptake protein n=1 Tax=Methanobacterium spitsbergense TaxID=2874285 RepID=A0A8T5V5E7_9EURY|nr:TrkH family potassium uptake protein [Methanobacterium spitsbergense]MBZ2166885.1 TrkH family potassium uptake protein [Methanobacterium spitsbergense]
MRSVHKLKKIELYSIIHYTGYICILLGLVMLVPIIVALIYGEYKFITPFIYSSIVSLVIGILLFKKFNNKKEISLKSAMIFVTLIWLIGSAIAALPYYLSGDLSYFNAFFEAMSGFTTTGFSMYNLDHASFTMNFWRAFTQWLGGIGIIVMALTVLSSPGVNIMRMYSAEGREERLAPSIRHTSRIILYIYLLYTAISIILFKLAGMPVFDSIFYAFTALSTGGFALENASISIYHNIWIELVAMIVMILGATNFALHYTLLKGNWREYFKDIESKVSWILLIGGTLLVALFLYNGSVYGHDIFTSLRYSAFQVVTALTTSGLQTANPSDISVQWDGLGIFILTLLMIIGAGACSTGGGIKWLRIGILVKGMWWEIKSLLLPQSAVISRKIHHVGDIKINENLLRLTGLFVFSYIVVYIISVIIVLFYYQNLSQVLFEVASGLSNVGLGSSLLTPSSPMVVKLVFMIDMWIGRLEIWPILLLMAIAVQNTIRR